MMHGGGTMPMMQGGMMPCPMWMMPAMGLLWLLLIAAAAVAAYLVIRAVRGDEALTILRREFASGAITEEEYRKRLAVLNGK